MKYVGTILNEFIQIEKVYSLHYFEYVKDFTFPGERHNFWEFVYVDKGAIEVSGNDRIYNLIKGDIIFHKPNEFHTIRAHGRQAPNLVIMSFSSRSPGMKWFEEKLLRLGNEEKNLLARILHEAGNAFSSKLNDPWLLALKRKKNPVIASEQLIKLYMELFLIGIIRHEQHIETEYKPASPLKEKTRKDAFNTVVSFFESHFSESPTLKTICRGTGFSCTYLENVCKEKTGRSLMEYYKTVKLEKAKDLIREGNYTFTQIALKLNFSSVHYFSKIFKKYIGMTPTEYSTSVKMKL